MPPPMTIACAAVPLEPRTRGGRPAPSVAVCSTIDEALCQMYLPRVLADKWRTYEWLGDQTRVVPGGRTSGWGTRHASCQAEVQRAAHVPPWSRARTVTGGPCLLVVGRTHPLMV